MPASGKLKFIYELNAGGTDHKVDSWASARGEYYPEYDCIFGTLQVFNPYIEGQPPSYAESTFSIALDRSKQAGAKPRIHVYVTSAGGGAPDEGSYTGDGK